jgi:hypothetical protein
LSTIAEWATRQLAQSIILRDSTLFLGLIQTALVGPTTACKKRMSSSNPCVFGFMFLYLIKIKKKSQEKIQGWPLKQLSTDLFWSFSEESMELDRETNFQLVVVHCISPSAISPSKAISIVF